MDDTIAIGQVHRKGRPRPHVVEAQRDHVPLAPERVLEPGGLLLAPQSGQPHPELDEPAPVDEPGSPRNPDPAPRRALPERTRLARVRDERRAAGDRLGLLALPSGVDGARGERQPPFARHLKAAALHGAAQLGVGCAGDGLAVHLPGPEEVETLLERGGADRGRNDETEEQADLDRPGLGSDVGPDRERPDRELGLGLRREKHLPVRGAGRRDEHERREDRAARR